MTTLFGKIAWRLGLKAEESERYIAWARAALFWERLWPQLWPATGVIGLYLAAGLFDVFAYVSDAVHLGLLFLATLWAGSLLHRSLRELTYPSWEEGARRVERDSRLAHRPISEGSDRLSVGQGDPWAEQLWRMHLRRLFAQVSRLRLALPSPRLQAKDRYALRFLVLGLVLAGFLVAGSDWSRRMAAAFTPDAGIGGSAVGLDAWINPPAYTGEAPLYLQRAADPDGPLAVPWGSVLVLRIHAAHGIPHVMLDPEPDAGASQFSGGNGEFGTEAVLARDEGVRVLADGKLLARLRIHVIADRPPVIAFTDPPQKTEHDALKIAFTARDDYGVTSVRAIIRPVAAHSQAMLSVDLPLASASAKTLAQTVYRDLTGEPLAGALVSIVLEAKDGAGQSGFSRPQQITLPARVFTNPLARALIEQRTNLAINAPHAQDNAARVLDALTLAPQLFYQNMAAPYLSIRAAYWSLLSARDSHDLADVEGQLWDTAAALEQGGVLSAAAQLRAIAQMLAQALAQGAPQDVIDALMERYRQAMQRYLEALAQSTPKSQDQMASSGKSITPEDLDALMKAIEQMAATGSRDAATQALAMLQNLLENLHMAQGGGAGGAGKTDKALSDAIQGLGDLIGRQRQLLDKSFRQSQGIGDPKDGGGKGLADAQGKLRDDLTVLRKALGPKATQTLGDAERAMGEAQKALGGNDFDSAGQSQKNALEALRNGADQLAKNLMQELGSDGRGKGQAQGNDPLGRQQGTSGYSAGDGTKLPDRDALARARSILEELRRRAAERSRPKEELDYYDRLLQAF